MSEKKPHRWQPTYNTEDILTVINKGEELKTSTIKKRLAEKDNRYETVSKEWFRIALGKLEKAELILRVNKEDEVAVYWKLKD